MAMMMMVMVMVIMMKMTLAMTMMFDVCMGVGLVLVHLIMYVCSLDMHACIIFRRSLLQWYNTTTSIVRCFGKPKLLTISAGNPARVRLALTT